MILRWITVVFCFAFPLLAAPFDLELLSEKIERDSNDPSYRNELRIYKVKDRPLHMQVRVVARKGVDIYQVHVFDPAEPKVTLGGSQSMVFYKRGKIESVSINVYGHNQRLPKALFDRPEYKGVGELTLQPVLSLPEIPKIRALLAHTNYTLMHEALGSPEKRPSIAELNDVVMEASHLGGILAAYGFDVDKDYTAEDRMRHEVFFQFLSEKARRPLWRRCWDMLPELRRRKPAPVLAP